ncbi:CPG4 domain-containing protein [Aphelenchoides besseyi]|nr:CPG4 domain-containing protein [Aphelenchoides besseyi]
MFLSFIFVFSFSIFVSSFPITLPSSHQLQQSPLDDPDEDTIQKPNKFGSSSLIPSANELSRLPLCQQACNEHFSEAMHIAMNAGNHFERYQGVCHYYNQTVHCQDALVNCQGRQTFDVMTTFNKVIECMDVEANSVQEVCEKKCEGRTRLTEWATKVGLLDILGRKKELPHFDGDQLRSVVQDVCDVAQCYLTCVRNEYNEKCGNSAGTLLSETVIRPFAETQNEPVISAMGTFLNLFAPRQCSFVINKDDMAAHRIDPELDRTLRQMNSTIEEPQVRTAGDDDQLLNGTALFSYDDQIDPIEIGQEWGFDIGMMPQDY